MSNDKVGKRELKKAGKERIEQQGKAVDFSDMEDRAEFPHEMQLQAEVNLGTDHVVRDHVEPGDEEVSVDEPDGDGHKYEQTEQTPLQASGKLDKLAKSYLALAVDSLRRVPATSLTEQFRSRLLTYRHMLGRLVTLGVKGEPKLVLGVVAALAVDGAGKIDAIVFLRQIMGQIMWSASMDVARLRRPSPDRDETRDAPIGMANMSDHSDAIAGIAGEDTNPTAILTEVDVYSAVEALHGFLSMAGDTLADTEDERIFLRLESGLSFTDERIEDPNFAGGARWEPVYDLDKAMDLQLVKNQESLVKREAARAQRRTAQLARLGQMFT